MRKSTLHFIFVLLAVTALAVIGHDYICGHMADNPFKPNECPLCAAYQSADIGQILLFSLLAILLPLLFGLSMSDQWHSGIPLYISIFSLRAPPRY